MYILAYKKFKNSPDTQNITSFKIYGNSLRDMIFSPIEECIVDFGDGTSQIYNSIEESGGRNIC